jgi:hypothetical protein
MIGTSTGLTFNTAVHTSSARHITIKDYQDYSRFRVCVFRAHSPRADFRLALVAKLPTIMQPQI